MGRVEPAVFEVLVVAFAVSLVGPPLAAHRVRTGDRRLAWLLFAPMLVIGGMIVSAALVTIREAPLVGVPFAIGALLYLFVLVRCLVRFQRAAATTTSPEDLLNSAFEALGEVIAARAVLVLVGSLMAVVAILVWGITHGGRL